MKQFSLTREGFVKKICLKTFRCTEMNGNKIKVYTICGRNLTWAFF